MLNRVDIMGRMVRSPEIRSTANGTKVANFTLACERDFQNGGEKQTDFLDCVAWRNTAEYVSKYFQKGSMAIVSGRLEISQYRDREGNAKKNTVVNVENIYFGASKNESAAEGGNTSRSTKTAKAAPETYRGGFEDLDDDDSDLPF